ALGIAGKDVADILYDTEPRIAVAGSTGRGASQASDAGGDSSISIVSSMMATGDEKIVAKRIVEVLSAKHTLKPAATPMSPAGKVSGRWDIEIQFKAGNTTHTIHLHQ